MKYAMYGEYLHGFAVNITLMPHLLVSTVSGTVIELQVFPLH